jgi:hypothetical protein
MKLLTELTTEITYSTVIEEKTKAKRMYVEGTTLQGEIKNQNNRIYPMKVLKEAVDKHTKMFMPNRAVGELDHPMETVHKITPGNVSHRFVEVKQNGNDIWTKALVLNTDAGKTVQNLIEGEVQLGISSRGFGDVKESEEANIVQSLYLVSLGDLVMNPSAPNALINAVMEGADWVLENGVLMQKEKEIEKVVDEIKETVEKGSRKEINNIMVEQFKKYFNTLLGK